MRSLSVLLLVALVASAAFVHAADDDVVVLDSNNFDSEIKDSSITLVEFFAPWCGHCKSLAPNYAKAATELKGTAKLASVDCTVEKDLCSRFGVQGFPTLKIFRPDQDKPTEYQGGRSTDAIVKYMRKQTEPAYTVLEDDAAFEAFDDREGVEIVGVFASLEDTEAKAFLSVAEELRNDYTFGVSTVAAHAEKVGASVPALILFKNENGEELSVHTSDAATLASAAQQKSWVVAEAFELVGEIGPENFQKYLDRGLPLVWSFLSRKPEDKEAAKAVMDALVEAAKEFKGKLSVVQLDGDRWREHAKHFGLSGNLPGIVIEDRDNNKNYVFPESETVTLDALKAHFDGFLSGSLQPTLKSQPEPEDNSAAVKVVVGTTFDSIVMDDAKDAFVEFYAPWCGHCKTLAPKWDELGAKFEADSGIVIAKVDATENDTPARIEGFPTILFYPAGDKANPVTYEGDRTVDAMVAFVNENRKTKAAPAEATEEPAKPDEDNKDEL